MEQGSLDGNDAEIREGQGIFSILLATDGRVEGRQAMTLLKSIIMALILIFACISIIGCTRKEKTAMKEAPEDCRAIALKFAQALTARNYSAAYGMTAKTLQKTMTADDLQKKFEAVVPRDWKTAGPVEIGTSMDSWPDRKDADRGWVYVSIGGDVYSEAITVIVADEGPVLKIREIEFGRP